MVNVMPHDDLPMRKISRVNQARPSKAEMNITQPLKH